MNEQFKTTLYNMCGQIYIPYDLKNSKKHKILHISDTPYNIYAPLNRLIKALKPDVIVHTGDMVDDIKLEICPYKIDVYKKSVRRLIRILENSGAQSIYIVPGNHDDGKYIKKEAPSFNIIAEGTLISIGDMSFCLSHDGCNIIDGAMYNLYGHSKNIRTTKAGGSYYLNGIEHIHVLLYPDEEVYYLPYPIGTNDARFNRCKISI
ncbi:metallophosphoesterase family protein [Xylanivirga thermophila]|uniref:metallophosphoesterase family protein n=1 Tax=Xylanivirga thermophila TaxID=2496273 RepID=UPI00101BFFBD|nr:metallophosphoesterase [Xylanivirga thermophila]